LTLNGADGAGKTRLAIEVASRLVDALADGVWLVARVLTADAFDQAWNEGRAMSLDDAVRYALDEQAGRDN